MTGTSFDKIMSSIPASAFADRGRFAPKLDFAQRCEILAFYHQGVSRNVLAVAFGIDRRTVTHIYNPISPHYKEVRKEWFRLGPDELKMKYTTEGGAAKIKQAVNVIKTEPESTVKGRQFSKDAGVHMVKTEYTRHEHRIITQWRGDQPFGEGWYYQDMDSDNPDVWLHNGAESMKTSQTCLKMVKENLSD